MTISGAYWSITGEISVNYWRNVGRVSFDRGELSAEFWSCIIRESSKILPIGTYVLKAPVGRHINRHIS